MMRQARQKIIVADHRKIGAIGTALICTLQDIDTLITDKGATDDGLPRLLIWELRFGAPSLW